MKQKLTLEIQEERRNFDTLKRENTKKNLDGIEKWATNLTKNITVYPWGFKELDTIEQLSLSLKKIKNKK